MHRLPSRRKIRPLPSRRRPPKTLASRRSPSAVHRWLTWLGRLVGLSLTALIVVTFSGLVFFLVGTDWLYARLISEPQIWLVTTDMPSGQGREASLGLVKLGSSLADARWLVLPSQITETVVGQPSRIDLQALAVQAATNPNQRARLSQYLAQPVNQVLVLQGDAQPSWWQIVLSKERLSLKNRVLLALVQRSATVQDVSETQLPKLGALVRKFLTQPDEQARFCAITIVNTTGLKGLASTASVWLESAGSYVARLLDEKDAQPRSLVILDAAVAAECQAFASQATLFLPESTTQAVAEDVKTNYRTPIVILLGADLGSLINSQP